MTTMKMTREILVVVYEAFRIVHSPLFIYFVFSLPEMARLVTDASSIFLCE